MGLQFGFRACDFDVLNPMDVLIGIQILSKLCWSVLQIRYLCSGVLEQQNILYSYDKGAYGG